MRGKKSWIAGAIAERAAVSGPPPAIFWRAPLDSDTASYGHAADATRLDGVFHVLRGLLEGKLAKEKVGTEADRKALASLLAMPLGKNTNVVIASGHWSAPPAPPEGADAAGPRGAGAIVERMVGWYLLGFDEGPATLSKLLKNVVAVYGRKALNERLRKALDRDAELLPTVKLVPAPAALGRGALDVEFLFERAPRKDAAAKREKKNEKKASFALHVLLMGEPQSTWIAIGANRDELVSRLLAAKAGAPEGGTLATRAGPRAAPLREGRLQRLHHAGLCSRGASPARSPTRQSAGKPRSRTSPIPSTTSLTRARRPSSSPRRRPATARAPNFPSTCRRARSRTWAPSC